jgi:hypothetical protein
MATASGNRHSSSLCRITVKYLPLNILIQTLNFKGVPDPVPPSRIWICNYSHQQAKTLRKTLISTVLWLLYDFLSLKSDVKEPTVSNKQEKLKNKLNCVDILKANKENSRIRIRKSVVRNRTSGSVPKRPGTGALAGSVPERL